MCFSPEASFISGAVLVTTGIYTLTKVKDKKYIPFAAIPLLFWLHQLVEGFMWLSLGQHCIINFDISWFAWTQHIWKYFFFLFSQVIWPSRIPISIWLTETWTKQKKWLWVLSIVGLCVSIYLGICLFLFDSSATILWNHIKYYLSFPPEFKTVVSTLYVAAIILWPFLSSNKLINRLWYVLAWSLALTFFFFRVHLISVRCFFAALISVYVYYIVVKANKNKEKVELQ